MFFLLAAGFALFSLFVGNSSNGSNHHYNQPKLVDKNYDFNIKQIQRKIMQSIIDNMQNIDNTIKLNETIIDSSFIKLELVLVELENLKFDIDSAIPKLDLKYNQVYLELIMDSFEMIFHLDAYLPFSKQISFQVKVLANKTQLGINYILQKQKLSLNKNWIQKFKVESFRYDIDQINQFALFFQDQVNDYLQKNHNYFENQLLQIFEKQMQQLNQSVDIIPPDNRIQSAVIVNSDTLRITARLYENEVLQLN